MNLILKCVFKSGDCCGVSENTNLSNWMYLLKKCHLEKFLGQYSERAWKLWKPCVLLRVRFVAKDGIEEVAGPEAAVWQSYPASSEACWNLMQIFSMLTAGKFWLRKTFKIFCSVRHITLKGFVCARVVWGSLCVWLLSCLLPALALSYVEGRALPHCKSSTSTKARLIWKWSALSACAVIKFSWIVMSFFRFFYEPYKKIPISS